MKSSIANCFFGCGSLGTASAMFVHPQDRTATKDTEKGIHTSFGPMGAGSAVGRGERGATCLKPPGGEAEGQAWGLIRAAVLLPRSAELLWAFGTWRPPSFRLRSPSCCKIRRGYFSLLPKIPRKGDGKEGLRGFWDNLEKWPGDRRSSSSPSTDFDTVFPNPLFILEVFDSQVGLAPDQNEAGFSVD